MYNVSSKYLELVQETSRIWDLYIDVQLRNGTQFRLTKHDLDLGSFRLKEGATCSDTVQIGSTYADSVEFRIINEDNKFTEYDFYRAKFWPYVGLDLSGESDFEYVPLGEFNILENVKKFSTIAVVGFNNMCQLNQVFDTSQIVFPTDAYTLLAALEQQCAVRVSEAALLEVRNVSQEVNSFLTEEYTCRDVLVGICLLLLKNARFNRAGELEFFWYAECNRNTSPTTRVGNSSYSDSVVNVTGVYLEDMFGSTYTAGTSNYAIELPFSPVIQGSEMSQMILNRALDKLALFTYRPATITWIGDPSLQAGDVLTHTSTAVGDCVIPIMRLVYAFAGTETLESVGIDAASNDQPTTSDRKAKQAFTKSEKDRVELSTAIKQTTDSISLEVSAGSVGNRAEIKLSVAGTEYRGYIDLTGLVTFTNLSTSGQTVISGGNLTTGIIKSADGSTFYLDLDNGVLIGKFRELSISGKTVDTIAQEKADAAEDNAVGQALDLAEAAAKAAVDAQTQLDIFNKLTKNGLLQGLYMENDNMYINASYIKSGKIISEGQTYLRPTYEDCMNMVWSLNNPAGFPPKDFYDLNGDGAFTTTDVLLALNVCYGKADISECVSLNKSTVKVTIDPSNPLETLEIVGVNMWGSEVKVSLGANKTTIPVISGNCVVGGHMSVHEYAEITKLAITVGGEPKTLSWRDNGDGTYTLIGQ